MDRVDHNVGVRVQGMALQDQALVIARLVEARSADGYFAPRDLENTFYELSLPAPRNVRKLLSALKSKGLVASGARKGQWRISPLGRYRSEELLSDIDLAALAAEARLSRGALLGRAIHTVIPPVLAPPDLIPGLSRFLAEHPFETNVFGMTRFPRDEPGLSGSDPIAPALEVAREVCRGHGLEFHLAADRAIHDDLWTNVAAHMWASRYGIAFFEDRRGLGLNYNLTIEVGAMLMTGRRCALLKDRSIERMPSDLVGRIYKEVDLDDLDTVAGALHDWMRNDLGLGGCRNCQ